MATRQAYTAYIIPDAHKLAINVGFALVNGDDATTADGFVRPCNATGDYEAPITHWLGGMWSDEQWETTISNMAASPPVPANGWPITRVEGGDIYEADVVAAAEALKLFILVTQDGSNPNPATAVAGALAQNGLMFADPPEEEL